MTYGKQKRIYHLALNLLASNIRCITYVQLIAMYMGLFM